MGRNGGTAYALPCDDLLLLVEMTIYRSCTEFVVVSELDMRLSDCLAIRRIGLVRPKADFEQLLILTAVMGLFSTYPAACADSPRRKRRTAMKYLEKAVSCINRYALGTLTIIFDGIFRSVHSLVANAVD